MLGTGRGVVVGVGEVAGGMGISFPDSSVGKASICNAGALGQFLGWEEPLENG